jgi:hypothetical protein
MTILSIFEFNAPIIHTGNLLSKSYDLGSNLQPILDDAYFILAVV